MKRSDEDRLLNQILADDVEDFRRSSLTLALRKNRQRRRTQTTMAVLGLVVVAALGAFHFAKPVAKLAPPIQTASVTKTAPTSTPAKLESHVKILTDEELFALFPDRQVALIGKPGHQQLIFLDGPNHQPIVAGEQVN